MATATDQPVPKPYVSPALSHAFEPGGRVLSIYREVDPATVCRHCMLGRPAHEK